MSSKKTRVGEEGATEPASAADGTDTSAYAAAQPVQILDGSVGQCGRIQMRPELLDGIQLRGIGRQRLDPEPVAVTGQGLLRDVATVSGQSVPEQDHRAASVPSERLEKAHNLGAAHAALVQSQKPAQPPTVGAGQHGADPRQLLPVERFHHARSLASRRPSGTDGGTLRERALVQKDQPGVQPCGVFFTCGQRPRTQRQMATSLRSRARRSGRWRLHPSCRSTRQTWETE